MVKNNLEFRTTVRFPQKDWEFIEKLVEDGEFCCVTDVIRAAVKAVYCREKTMGVTGCAKWVFDF